MPTPPHSTLDIPEALASLSGTVLEGRYRIGRVLGSGGMGAVFEAQQLRLDRSVAIKVLRPEYATQREYIERFIREAKSASKIRHRNVVEVVDYGEADGGLIYSVMEFLVGEDLEQMLRSQPQGRIAWAEAVGLLVQIASGLKAAHGHGVIHRDIKPANCFATAEDGEEDSHRVVKVVDFGIARLEGGCRGHTLTRSSQVLGTPSYIAPEVVRNEVPASVQSDIYALGVLMYRMLVGTVPFSGDTMFEVLRKACFDPVPSLRTQVPELPVGVEALVVEMLAKEPHQRPPNMKAVRDRLVMLGRQSLGPQAIPVSGSGARSLSLSDRGPSPSSAVAVPVDAVPATSVGGMPEHPRTGGGSITEETLEPRSEVAERRSGRTLVAAPSIMGAGGGTSPASGVPKVIVHDLPSTPWRPGETVPLVGDAVVRRMDAWGSIDRTRNRGAMWGVASVVGALVVGGAGVLVGPEMLRDEAKPNVPSDSERFSGRAPIAEVEAQRMDGTRADETEAQRADGTRADGMRADGTRAGPGGAEGGVGPEASSEAAGPVVVGAPDPVVLAVDDGPEPDDSEVPDRAGEQPAVSLSPPPSPQPKPKPRSKPAPEPAGPPSDSVLRKRLTRTIAAQCASELGGGSVLVKFLVGTTGTMMGLTAIPVGAAGDCAKSQVQGTKFRERSKSVPFEFTVRSK